VREVRSNSSDDIDDTVTLAPSGLHVAVESDSVCISVSAIAAVLNPAFAIPKHKPLHCECSASNPKAYKPENSDRGRLTSL
jgi:hypothetical protein